MQFVSIDRADLARVLAGQKYNPLLLQDGDVTIASSISDRRLLVPQALFVRGLPMDEFFAWANTYLPIQQPLSTMMHVLPYEMLPWYRKQLETESCSVLPVAGAIVARDLFVGGISLSPLSYAMGVALVLDLGTQWCDRVFERWRNIRTAIGGGDEQDELGAREEVDFFWRIVMGSLDTVSDSLLEEALKDLSSKHALTSRQASDLIGTSVDVSKLDRARVSRDEKLPLVNELIDKLRTANASPVRRAFMAGYAMSRLALGSVEYASLLAKQDMPASAALWYGYVSLLCADPAPGPTTAQLQGISHRLIRAKDVTAFPTCHCSFDELTVLTRIKSPLASIPPHETIRIELAPFVTVWFPQRDAERVSHADVFAELSRLLRRSMELVDGASNVKAPNKRRR